LWLKASAPEKLIYPRTLLSPPRTVPCTVHLRHDSHRETGIQNGHLLSPENSASSSFRAGLTEPRVSWRILELSSPVWKSKRRGRSLCCAVLAYNYATQCKSFFPFSVSAAVSYCTYLRLPLYGMILCWIDPAHSDIL
jgi:hypothetical protein